MPALFWGFLAIVIVVLGLALIALRPRASDRPRDKGNSPGGMWWATDAGSGDCGDGGCD